MDVEEQVWISQAASGDSHAFAHLVERYEKQVYHHALRLVGNAEDAADISQEVFWKAWRALPTFRRESSFSTWLYRLTDNACVDLLRREKKRRGDASLEEEEGSSLAQQLPHPDPSPQERVEAQERQDTLEQGLAQLSQEHRRILVLRELSGLSYQEIGAMLNLSPGTVKSRLARARLALANYLRQSGNFSP
ncbi:sigma-70 family RNA polymerase sigma factor [Pseudoflavonifractor sp. An85]|uniref:RNA polymerase sigma factor n=1 Tax=Pseudoflavonifractor sp. An85 TaxID=1965661 RepID=UPI000B3ACC7F|nr:sigma-70 family RNA polymerase sigma factor [Pseudoflavonifractor sp. An85]OUN25352.1 RNA polymerase subunit sigma [Pseudoflavonifractor sp. An85]